MSRSFVPLQSTLGLHCRVAASAMPLASSSDAAITASSSLPRHASPFPSAANLLGVLVLASGGVDQYVAGIELDRVGAAAGIDHDIVDDAISQACDLIQAGQVSHLDLSSEG